MGLYADSYRFLSSRLLGVRQLRAFIRSLDSSDLVSDITSTHVFNPSYPNYYYWDTNLALIALVSL